jgi:hypothetical protein
VATAIGASGGVELLYWVSLFALVLETCFALDRVCIAADEAAAQVALTEAEFLAKCA